MHIMIKQKELGDENWGNGVTKNSNGEVEEGRQFYRHIRKIL